MKNVTLSEFLLNRLCELGIEDIFGVPGDYNLKFLDSVVNHKKLNWIGTCNELNASYAADAYGRLKGVSCLVTTAGVGELSAINGIAGAFAERAPIVNIVGLPSTKTLSSGALIHHFLGDGNCYHFMDMYKHVTIAQVLLNNLDTAAENIDFALRECVVKKLPVYIGIPLDVCDMPIPNPNLPLNLNLKKSDEGALQEAVTRIAEMLNESKNPIAILDICAHRHGMKPFIDMLLNATKIPFVTRSMGRGLLSESHPQFLGLYNGALSQPISLQEYVESSDCILSFGSLLTDLNTGGFSNELKVTNHIDIHSSFIKIKNSTYSEVLFYDLIPELLKKVTHYSYQGNILKIKSLPEKCSTEFSIFSQDYFWNRIEKILPKNSVILAEIGTSYFGLSEIRLPDGAKFVAQTLWASIGYSVGALLGACAADKINRSFLFVGDGSFQLTAQEISTIMRYGFTPVVFLINNNGYTIERLIHGEKMIYNDIQNWNYAELPKIFNGQYVGCVVQSKEDLEVAIRSIKENPEKLVFIEVCFSQMDTPRGLVNFTKAMAKKENKQEINNIK